MSSTYPYKPPLGLDIRIKPPKETAKAPRERLCAWPGCESKGHHRAPKTGDSEDHQWLCLDHVREFNRSWNFFQGMSDSDVKRYIEDSFTGHRPTWSMGTNKSGANATPPRGANASFKEPKDKNRFHYFDDMADPFNIVSGSAARAKAKRHAPSLTRKQIEALETFDLTETATRSELKMRYKELVKKYHPDANGGDTAAVERLRSVIRAYQALKTAKLSTDS